MVWKQSKAIELSLLCDKIATPSRDDLIGAAQVLNHDVILRHKSFQHRAMTEFEKKCGLNADGKKLCSFNQWYTQTHHHVRFPLITQRDVAVK